MSWMLSIDCKNRSTYQCWPSFKTIGKATRMSTNTAHKYVRMLEDRGLITTEPTSIITEGGQKRNGNLLFHHPSNPGSSRTILPAADGENISGCTEEESIRYESQAGTPCVTGCARLCEVFPVGVGNRCLIPSRPLFGPILRQLEEARSIAPQKTKRLP